MTGREKTVVRAIVKALRGQGAEDMDALATSYPGGRHVVTNQPVHKRAALLLEALTNVEY